MCMLAHRHTCMHCAEAYMHASKFVSYLLARLSADEYTGEFDSPVLDTPGRFDSPVMIPPVK